jgi:hypothetical protein
MMQARHLLWWTGLLAAMPLAVAHGDPVLLYVGTGAGEYTSLSSAVDAATAGYNSADMYTIDVDPGTYTNDAVQIDIPLTIQNDNPTAGAAIFDDSADQGASPTYTIANGKAILVTDANVTINGLSFEGAAVAALNGAGIRGEAGNLTVINSSFIDNQNGILTAPNASMNILVEGSSFIGNGIASGPGAGYAHAIYAGADASLTVRNSTFNGTKAGHDIKSRAAVTTITGNHLDDGVTGTTSYAVDVSNGGVATLTGNTIVQGVNTQNYAMVAYDSEGLAYSDNSLLVQDNAFINYLPGGSIGVENFSGGNGDPPVYAQLIGNTFTDLSGDSPSNFQPLAGPGSITAAPEPGTLPLFVGALLLWPVMCGKRVARARSGHLDPGRSGDRAPALSSGA